MVGHQSSGLIGSVKGVLCMLDKRSCKAAIRCLKDNSEPRDNACIDVDSIFQSASEWAETEPRANELYCIDVDSILPSSSECCSALMLKAFLRVLWRCLVEICPLCQEGVGS